MRLLFDHGTLVLADAPDLDFEFVPGLIWDPRVALFRAPAWRYGEVVRALGRRELPFVDEVRPSAPEAGPAPDPGTGPWHDVELRPYQRGALLSWEVGRRRGIVV